MIKLRSMIGLTSIIALASCLKPLDERAIDIAVGECNVVGNGASIRNLDLPGEKKYLTLSEIAYVDKVLQEKNDCRLRAVYADKVTGDREYAIQKKNSSFVVDYPSDYTKIYPHYCD